MKYIVALVGGVEELRDGRVGVEGRVGHGGVIRVLEFHVRVVWAVVFEVLGSAAGVGLRYAVVAAGAGVVGATIAEPGEL